MKVLRPTYVIVQHDLEAYLAGVFKRKLPSRSSRNILTSCVFQQLFNAISCMHQFVPRGNAFLIEYRF